MIGHREVTLPINLENKDEEGGLVFLVASVTTKMYIFLSIALSVGGKYSSLLLMMFSL